MVDWSDRSTNELACDESLSKQERANRLGCTLCALQNQIYKIRAAGGIDAYMKMRKNYPARKTQKPSLVDETSEYADELKFLHKSGYLNVVIRAIRDNMNTTVMDYYVHKVCEKIRKSNILTVPEFFMAPDAALVNLTKAVMAREVYTKETATPEYGELIKSSMPEESLKGLEGHYLKIEDGVYYLDKFAMDKISSDEKLKDDSLDEKLGKYETSILESNSILPVPEIEPPTSGEILRKAVRLTIDERLWDKEAKPLVTYSKIKSLYKKNREYFNSLIAIREEYNAPMVSVSGLQFYDYCADHNRNGENVYMIRKGKDAILYLFIKKTDFEEVLINRLKKYKIFPDVEKYMNKLKLHKILCDNKSHPETNSVVINYNALKSSLAIKNGILNSIINFGMY